MATVHSAASVLASAAPGADILPVKVDLGADAYVDLLLSGRVTVPSSGLTAPAQLEVFVAASAYEITNAADAPARLRQSASLVIVDVPATANSVVHFDLTDHVAAGRYAVVWLRKRTSLSANLTLDTDLQ